MTQTRASRRRILEQALADRHGGAITVLMNMLFARQLLGVYRRFEGDMVEAIVLGEVAHHNLAALMSGAGTPHELSEALQAAAGARRQAYLPTNAFSIAQSTGIPRETVRRKVDRLTRRGWLVKDADGNLFVALAAGAAFATFHAERLPDLLDTARAIETLLADPPGPTSTQRRTAGTSSRARGTVVTP